MQPDRAQIEKLFWALREAGLTDMVTRDLTMKELDDDGLLPPGALVAWPAEYAPIRAALATDFASDEEWRAAHEALFRVERVATEFYTVPGAIEERAPGYSREFYARLYADTAFAMR